MPDYRQKSDYPNVFSDSHSVSKHIYRRGSIKIPLIFLWYYSINLIEDQDYIKPREKTIGL